MKTAIHDTKHSKWVGKAEITTMPIIIAVQFPSIAQSYQGERLQEVDFSFAPGLEFKDVIDTGQSKLYD